MHKMSRMQCMGAGCLVIYMGPGFEPTTIVVKVYCTSNSQNSTHTELETTPIHLCLHHLRRNTV